MYFSPNSPGANVSEEQKPSDELIRSVDPSFDLEMLARNVNTYVI